MELINLLVSDIWDWMLGRNAGFGANVLPPLDTADRTAVHMTKEK